jgi:hypothetical protein
MLQIVCEIMYAEFVKIIQTTRVCPRAAQAESISEELAMFVQVLV